LLTTNFITKINIGDLVSSGAAACGEDWAAALFALLATGVVIDDDNFIGLSELVQVGANFSLACLGRLIRHTLMNHSHF